MSKRTNTHLIDTRAIKCVIAALPEHWVLRELSERDYGIDLMIEIFEEAGYDKKNKPYFLTTGGMGNLQIKGMDEKFPSDGKAISFQADKDFLKYAERFFIPFFLLRVSNLGKEIYFLWVQGYIKNVLDVDKPNWRTTNTETIAIKIPRSNDLSKRTDKIEKIIQRVRYREELLEYVEKFTTVLQQMDAIALGQHATNARALKFLEAQVIAISRLNTLLSINNCCVDSDDIDNLLKLIRSKDFTRFSQIPQRQNMELLADEIYCSDLMEFLVTENEGDNVY